jgi:hypothetical protein
VIDVAVMRGMQMLGPIGVELESWRAGWELRRHGRGRERCLRCEWVALFLIKYRREREMGS